MIKNHNNYLEKKFMELAFKRANEHLGSTKENPSVGCVVVKNNSVISSGVTSIKGRPHAEVNALKINKNFKDSTMYITLEPCVHYGVTNPCVNQIIKKKVKKVYYPIIDEDKRTQNKAKNILKNKKIDVKIGILKDKAKIFYKSYFLSKKKNLLPFVDAKIAISKDCFSVDRKKKWITNKLSRSRVHFLRSQYDCILSTYKSINDDNSLLNCRLSGLEELSPARVIIDQNFKLKRNLHIYNNTNNIKTYIITGARNKKKEKFFKSKNVKIIKLFSSNNHLSYYDILKTLKKKGFSRIFCESGLKTTKKLLDSKLIYNLYVFKSPKILKNNGKKSYKNLLKKLKFKKKEKININLFGDQLYKFRIK